MRNLAISSVLLAIAIPATAVPGSGAERTFPYKAKVARNLAPIRSAASDAAYATDALAVGAEIEVFSHEPNGWCSIRPPAGSFSWAPARFLKTTSDEKLAEVIDDGVVAWIGSRVAGVSQPHWQVRLKKGEIVEVFGANRLASAEGGVLETWCKIAPPAGEFRWIHVEDLVAAKLNTSRGAEDSIATAAFQEASTERPAAGSIEALEKELDGSSQPPAAWRLSAMIEEATARIQGGSTAVERGKARLLLERLEEMNAKLDAKLDAIQPRNQAPAAAQVATRSSEPPPVQAASYDAPVENTTPAAAISKSPAAAPAAGTQSVLVAASAPRGETRYDAQGWLMPVLLRRSELPPFAITDKEGKIIEYVSPAPGLNLHRYLKQEIGVFGHRSEGERLGTPHLTVQRVVVLDRHR